MPITFNTILSSEALQPEKVQLIRHTDKRLKDKTLFDVWFTERGLFENYQSIQKKWNFPIGEFVASFVVTKTEETIFVGIYECFGQRNAEDGEVDPVVNVTLSKDHIVHDLRKTEYCKNYEGRLHIKPWKDAINYVKRANAIDPEVLALSRQVYDEPFPGFLRFNREIADIPNLFPSWKVRLSEARGVYLLVCKKTGEQYVGSATGASGFLGRWVTYANDGHGGNAQLKVRENAGYTVVILEVAGSRDSDQEVQELERVWKQKLGSRAFGLNDNL